MAREPHCCLSCGRDTTALYGVCARCTDQWTLPVFPEECGRKGRKPRDTRHEPLEDDYSEESNADSVYRERGDVDAY